MAWMPKLPTSGKARVLAELTGQIGGSRMRRRFQRKVPKRDLFWFANEDTITTSTFQVLGQSAATLAYVWSPYGSAADQFQQQFKLMRTQGYWMVYVPPNDSADVVSDQDTGAFSGPQLLSYWWTRGPITREATGLAQAASANDPQMNGDLQYILKTRSVLNWGIMEVPVWQWKPQAIVQQIPAGAFQTDINTSHYYLEANRNRSLGSFGRIPGPRIPRGGMNLGRDQALELYVRPMNVDVDNNTPIGTTRPMVLMYASRHLLAR